MTIMGIWLAGGSATCRIFHLPTFGLQVELAVGWEHALSTASQHWCLCRMPQLDSRVAAECVGWRKSSTATNSYGPGLEQRESARRRAKCTRPF